jgi:hypothetical protein
MTRLFSETPCDRSNGVLEDGLYFGFVDIMIQYLRFTYNLAIISLVLGAGRKCCQLNETRWVEPGRNNCGQPERYAKTTRKLRWYAGKDALRKQNEAKGKSEGLHRACV